MRYPIVHLRQPKLAAPATPGRSMGAAGPTTSTASAVSVSTGGARSASGAPNDAPKPAPFAAPAVADPSAHVDAEAEAAGERQNPLWIFAVGIVFVLVAMAASLTTGYQ